MTRAQRERVVELLRCGYDRSNFINFAFLSTAAARIYGEANCEEHHLAYAAAEDVYKKHWWLPFVDCLLEAALLVERGEWP